MIVQPPQGFGPLVILSRLVGGAALQDPLQEGDFLLARVLAQEEGRVALLVRGVRLEARSDVPLQVGETLALRVKELHRDRLVLQLAEPVTGRADPPSGGQAGQAASPLLAAALLPFLAGGQPTEAGIRVDEEQDDKHGRRAGKAELQVVVYWEGPRLGPVQVRFSLQREGAGGPAAAPLTLRFTVATAEARSLGLDQAPTLPQAMLSLGW
ncbi:MAG: hypothetical protein ACM3ZA_11945, partial [Bacillota bacterium]